MRICSLLPGATEIAFALGLGKQIVGVTHECDYPPDAQQKPVMVPLKAGSCTFHDGLTFHYAHANQTQMPRRAYAIIYTPDGTTYTGKPHVVTKGQPLSAGQPLSGPLFPLHSSTEHFNR